MLQIYSIFDKKTSSYEKPFFCAMVQEAIQAIQYSLEEKKAYFSKYPADFALYQIGTFDVVTGQVLPTATVGPQFVIEVAALLRAPVEVK